MDNFINDNIHIDNQGARAPSIQITADHFQCMTRKKLRVFVLKVAIPDPDLTFFMNVMQLPGPDLLYGRGPGAPRSNGKTFFWPSPNT